MKKMLPEGAVRQKMMMEGIPSAEIDDFFTAKVKVAPASPVITKFGDGSGSLEDRLLKFERLQRLLNEAALLPPAPTSNLLLTVFDERLVRYEKMFRMLQDAATVRRKMMSQGCTAPEVDKFFRIVQSTSSSISKESEDMGECYYSVALCIILHLYLFPCKDLYSIILIFECVF